MNLCVLNVHTAKQSYSSKYLSISTCTRMLMHGIVCRDHIKAASESALKLDSGRTIPCHTGNRTSASCMLEPTLNHFSPVPAPSYALTLRLKWRRMIISPSQGWKKACLMLLYRISTLSPRTDVNRNPDKTQLRSVILIYTITNHNCI